MKHWSRQYFCILLGLIAVAGCASKGTWNSRVGHYTLEQAVHNMGKPNSLTPRPDGTLVAEWQSNAPDSSVGYKGADAGLGDWMKSDSMTIYPTGKGPGRDIRLTFGSDGQLQSWEDLKNH